MKKATAKFAAILTVIIMLCLTLPFAGAKDKVDVTRGVSLSVEYKHNGAPIADVAFSVYKVAHLTPNGHFVPADDFVRYSVDYDNLSADKMKNLSDTLLGYIKRDKITPLSKAVTDANGFAAFYFKKMQTAGLYLIVGEKKEVQEMIYTPEVMLISLPAKAQDESYLNTVKAVPKTEVDSKSETTDIEITKVWKNDKGENRPESVTVQLMKDNTVYDEVTLNKNNNWRHEWKNLDIKHFWTVAEKTVPDGYEVCVNHSGKNYIISNTYDSSLTTQPSNPDDTTNPSDTTSPTGTTSPSDTTSPTGTTNPSDTTSSTDTTNPSNTKPSSGITGPSGTTSPTGTTNSGATTDSGTSGTTNATGTTTAPSPFDKTTSPDETKPNGNIPQTGMLEWPIPLMLEFGVTFIVIGIIFCIRKKNGYEK